MSDQTPTLPTIPPEQIAAMRANWHTLGLPIEQFDAAAADHGTPPAPLPPAAPSADPTLPPDQLAEARIYWVGQGYDLAAFDAAVAADANPAEPLAPTLSADQAERLAETLTAAGKTEAEIAATLAAHGMVPDDRTPDEIEWDIECGFGEHHEPSAYKLDIRATGIAGTADISTLLAIGGEWGNVLSAMQIAPSIGTDLAEKSISLAHRLAASTPAERQLWKMDQRAQALARAGSTEALAERIRLAGVAASMAISAGHSEAVEAMIASGALDDAYTIQTLANHGLAIETWRTGPAPRLKAG